MGNSNTINTSKPKFILPKQGSYLGIRCVVVGDGNVGKSSLLRRIVNGWFDTAPSMTLKEHFAYEVKFQGASIDVTLWDTAGQDDYDQFRVLAYPNTDVFIITFSFDSPSSFQRVKTKWFPEIRKNCTNSNPIILLVGCKLDQVVAGLHEHTEAPVDCVVCGPALGVAAELGAVDYFETSSLTGYGFKEIREAIVGAVLSPASHIHSRFARNICGLQHPFTSLLGVELERRLPLLNKDLIHVVIEYAALLDYLRGIDTDISNALITDCMQFREALEGRKWNISQEMSRAEAKDCRHVEERIQFIQARLAAQTPRPPPSPTHFKCVAGDGIVWMADGSRKLMRDLQVDDCVKTATFVNQTLCDFNELATCKVLCLEIEKSSSVTIGNAKILHVFSSAHNQPLSLVRFNTLLVTKCHPIIALSSCGPCWVHPEELHSFAPVVCSELVNIVLDRDHAFIVNGFVVASLGADVGARLRARRPSLDHQFGTGFWRSFSP